MSVRWPGISSWLQKFCLLPASLYPVTLCCFSFSVLVDFLHQLFLTYGIFFLRQNKESVSFNCLFKHIKYASIVQKYVKIIIHVLISCHWLIVQFENEFIYKKHAFLKRCGLLSSSFGG